MEKIKSENKEENIVVNKTTQEKKTTQPDFAEILAKMQKQIDEQAAIISKQNQALSSLSNGNLNQNNNTEIVELLKNLSSHTPTLNMVKVIYLEDCGGAQFKLQNGRTIKFAKDGANQSTYGKIVPVSMEEAILLLNEYTGTFERGALKFDEDHMYMLREKGIDVDSINYKPLENIQEIEVLDDNGIRTLYASLKAFQKEMLKTYVVKCINQNKCNETFLDKIKLLNKLSKPDSIDGKTGQYELILSKLKDLGIE